jgi:hypothetical protein
MQVCGILIGSRRAVGRPFSIEVIRGELFSKCLRPRASSLRRGICTMFTEEAIPRLHHTAAGRQREGPMRRRSTPRLRVSPFTAALTVAVVGPGHPAWPRPEGGQQ